MSNLPSRDVRFVRINGRIVPIKVGAGSGGFKGKYFGGNKARRLAQNTMAAAKQILTSKKGLKLAAGYGGLGLGAYGAKKAWDGSNEVGKGAMAGAAVGAGITASNLFRISKNGRARYAYNVASKAKPKIAAAIALAPTLFYGAVGAGFGALQRYKNKKAKK